MNNQFKPGDLALIVDCKLPELIGSAVELVSQVGPWGDLVTDRYLWINDSSTCAWVVSGDGLIRLDTDGVRRPCQMTIVAEHKLMPLRGDFQPERQQSREVPA